MATLSQITANRENAHFSTGPVTASGKAAASQNARKYGLASGFAILPTEDPNAYNELLARINAEMQPVTEHEGFLVDLMTQARWKLERIRGVEERLLERILAGEPCGNDLNLMMRYSAAAERSYYKSHKEFTEARKQQNQASHAAFKQALDAHLAPPPGHNLASFGKTAPAVAGVKQPTLAAPGFQASALRGQEAAVPSISS